MHALMTERVRQERGGHVCVARPTPMGAHERELQCSLKPLMFAAFLPGMGAFDRSLAFDLNA